MSWQVLIILQTVLVAFSMLSLRAVTRQPKMARASIAMNASWYPALYISGILLLPWLGHVNAGVLGQYFWRFVGGGLAFAITNILTYKTLVYFDAAVATIASTVNSFFTVVGAALILGEDLTVLQVFGGIILLSAITYGVLSTRLPEHTKRNRRARNDTIRGCLYAISAGIFFAVAIINEKSLLESMSAGTYAVFGWGGQVVMSVIVALLLQPKAFRLLKDIKIASYIGLTGILRGVGGACFVLAEVHSNNVALVTVISNFRIILVALLGWWLLKERDYITQKVTAAISSVAGLTIMFWK